MGQPYFYTEYGGSAPVRTGASHATIAPYGPFDAADGTVYLSIQNEREWLAFCRDVLGRPALADDPRFATNSGRVKNRDLLIPEIDAIVSALRLDVLTKRLDAAGIANAMLRDMKGFAEHPQLAARGRWRSIDTPAGPVRALVPPVTAPWDHVMGAVPDAGADTERILTEFGILDLSLTEDDGPANRM
jgi:crotonobetainyl-CoA:carnitine CoA-transferase CaiB-like acyl-CoA transferase